MKILYRQGSKECCLSQNGIFNCYFKFLTFEKDNEKTAFKGHHHGYFEIHAVVNGAQEYEINGKKCEIPAGSFVIISPRVTHKTLSWAPDTEKATICIYAQSDFSEDFYASEMSPRMFSNITFVLSESANKKDISSQLIENSILETITGIFRLIGHKESKQSPQDEENSVLALAKQFIDDSIESSPSVLDVANYCYLSTKQLTRLFLRYDDITPGDYIVKQRVARIEKYLLDGSLSLKEVSERMSFSSEYYFNSFFRKHAGMPPGAYKKTIGK